MSSLAERTRTALADGDLDLAVLGGGRTARRWAGLLALAVADVDLARLGEAHVDGVQILCEAGIEAAPGTLYGVWASEHPTMPVTIVQRSSSELTLMGSKAFCSGAGIVDEALVTVASEDGPLLVRVPRALIGPDRINDTAWKVAALRDVRTATVDLDDVVVPAEAVVGPPRWYLERPGFWPGALGPAACWAGAAIGLVHLAVRQASADPHSRAHLGAMSADERALRSLFDVAGREVDAAGLDDSGAKIRALEVRHLVDMICADVEDRFTRCLGPRALAFDAVAADRLQALGIYRRQCHGERDLAALGAMLRER